MNFVNAVLACLMLCVAIQSGACAQMTNDPVKVASSPSKVTSSSTKSASPARPTQVANANVSGEQEITAYLTGYSSESNDPPNSTTIWLDGRQGDAGGTGTYADPITVAVADGQFKYGTLFYVPRVKRYFKASDSCPPCRAGRNGLPHLDVYVGDARGSEVHKCKARLTGIQEIVLNPKASYQVQNGPIFNGTCTI